MEEQKIDWRSLVPAEFRGNPGEESSGADILQFAYGDENHKSSIDPVHLDDLLRETIERKASDLHLTVGLPPMIRLDGELVQLPYEKLSGHDTRRLIYEVLNDAQLNQFEITHDLDFSYGITGIARFRFNVYQQRGAVGAAMRAISSRVPSIEELRLPPIVRELIKRNSGLILVTGSTGSGKSTTIASMIDEINTNRQLHIMTIEDPIEYLHTHKKGMVNQREVLRDTDSFANSLKAVLREDPDVILIGEMRDLETIQAALTLAETGHLVFATLHTRNAPQSIDRMIDVFPAHQQEQIRVLLSNTLEAVISQHLLVKLGGGRIAAIEVLIATAAIRNLVREAKTHQIYSVMETSAQQGMITMDRVLAELHRSGHVSYEEAATRAIDKENFTRFVRGG